MIRLSGIVPGGVFPESDLHLDGRPLGEILSDSKAVDWDALRGRLGALAPALGPLTPNLSPPPE